MIRRTIKVIYKGKLDRDTDDKITRAMKKEGFIWTGQGFNFESKERDITFKAREV